MITGLNHITIAVKILEKYFQFYKMEFTCPISNMEKKPPLLVLDLPYARLITFVLAL